MNLRLTVLSLLCLYTFSGQAQKLWSLSDCIEYAHANNLQIKRTELSAEAAKEDLLQSKLNLLPNVNMDLRRGYSFGRNVNPVTNEYTLNNFYYDNYGIGSEITLFSGLQNYNEIRRNQYATLAALQNVEKEKVEKTLEISTAYLAILYQQELVDEAENQREVTSLQVERTGKLVEAGSVAKGDLLEIQAQLANENLNVTEAQNQLKLSVLNLIQLLDLDSAGGFEIVTPDTIDPLKLPALPEVTEVYIQALEFLPHIKSAEYQLSSDEKTLLIQQGRLSPSLYLSGGYSTYYTDRADLTDESGNPVEYPYGDQFKDNLGQSVGIRLFVPIFNRGQVNNGISKAKIQVEDSKFMLEQVKQTLYKNIQQAHNDAVSAREKYNSAMEAVNSYRESFHYTEQKYNVGIVNSVEYNIAKNNFIKAESQLLQAKYEYVFASKILDFYRGIPMSL